MDWTWFHQLGQLEFWEGLLAGFEDLGPLVPILLAAVESFFPPLPLVAIVALNVAAHGGVLAFCTAGWGWPQAAPSCSCSGGGWSSGFLEAGQPLPQAGTGAAVGEPP